MLRLSDIHTFYGTVEALKGIGLEIRQGEIVCLIGANGAGKTTTMMSICGVMKVARGSITFLGREIQNAPSEHIVREGISLVPEGRKIFPLMTVMENLDMGAFLRSDREGIREDLDRVYRLFPVLRERGKQLGGTLSGGEQQMLAIGRALMARPRLLILDEPSLGLAPRLVQTIFATITEIRDQGTTIFLVEQNAHMALRTADRGYVMETGRIVMEGAATALRRDEAVRRTYLGD